MVDKIILELPADTVGGDILVSTETRERAETAAAQAEFAAENTGKLTSASVVTLDAGSDATVELAGPLDAREAVFGIPRGYDGSNVLPTDEAIAQAITTPGSETQTQLNATIALESIEKPLARGHRQIKQFDFSQKAVSLSGRYLIAGMTDTLDGAFVLGYRDGSKHDLAAGSDFGKLYVTRSVDDGDSWSEPVLVADHSAALGDVRDPFLYRRPGTRRIYQTYFIDQGDGVQDGTWITYSDDDGRTWPQPERITTGSIISAGGLRLSLDGIWRMPVYHRVGGLWRAGIITATDPLGTWSAPVDIYAPVADNATEADVLELAEDNWIAAVRVNGKQGVILQSTDNGATWSAPTELRTISGRLYQGWPSLRWAGDRVLLFIRANGGGGALQVLQLLDTAMALDAGAWHEPGTSGAQNGGSLLASGFGFVGNFQPFLIGGMWVGCFMYETADDGADIRIGRYASAAQASAFSFISTGQGPADGSPVGWQGFATPSKVTVLSRGGWYRMRWQLRSSQPSGTVSNYQVELTVNGTRRNQAGSSDTHLSIGGTAQPLANSSYHEAKEGVGWLSAGLHEVELCVHQQNTTIGRMFYDRLVLVEPLT